MLICSPIPRIVPLSHYVRSLLLSDPQAGGSIAMCAVFVSSFSRHPLESEDEAAARSGGWRRRQMRDLSEAVAMMARGRTT